MSHGDDTLREGLDKRLEALAASRTPLFRYLSAVPRSKVSWERRRLYEAARASARDLPDFEPYRLKDPELLAMRDRMVSAGAGPRRVNNVLKSLLAVAEVAREMGVITAAGFTSFERLLPWMDRAD